MRILLERYYTGVKSGMQMIHPGEYEDRELPGGLARYLVDTDHATDITPQDEAGAPESQGFESWPLKDIRAFASANEINVGGMNKADAIEAVGQWVSENAVLPTRVEAEPETGEIEVTDDEPETDEED